MDAAVTALKTHSLSAAEQAAVLRGELSCALAALSTVRACLCGRTAVLSAFATRVPQLVLQQRRPSGCVLLMVLLSIRPCKRTRCPRQSSLLPSPPSPPCAPATIAASATMVASSAALLPSVSLRSGVFVLLLQYRTPVPVYVQVEELLANDGRDGLREIVGNSG